jgi:aldehyde:ferredoxin oxidoreductase
LNQKWYGWSGRILRINLTTGKVIKQDLPRDLAKSYIGGRGINAKILYDEVKPGTDAFSSDNILIFGTGPLNGTPVGMGRMSVSTKSSRGCMAEGGFGGYFAPELKFAGYDHLVVYGRAEKPCYIWIDDENVEIRDATNIWGRDTWETDRIIKEEVGDYETQICCIGPAGENLVAQSVIIAGLVNSGGRGCGQVMGAKKLKAIAVRGSEGVEVAYPEEFEQAYMKIREILEVTGNDPFIAPFRLFGSTCLVRIFNEAGWLQTYNSQTMRFKYADEFSGEKYHEKYVRRPLACFCCFANCKRWYDIIDGSYAGTKGGNMQMSGLICFNSNVGVKELDASLNAWTMCNRLGLDAFHAGYAISWAMECFEKGIITSRDTDGIELRFGNYVGMIEMISKIAYREGFGDVLANGVENAAKLVGRGSERYVLSIKGLEPETMPLRALYVAALGVAVSETGPDHTKWYPPYPLNPAMVSSGLLKELNLNISLENALQTRLLEGKGRLLKFLEDSRAFIESLPTCVLLLRGILSIDMRPWISLLVAGTGVGFTYEEVMRVGERIKNVERAFIVREGFRRKDDALPRRIREEAVPECGLPPLTSEIFNRMLDEYYEERGWDKETSIPTKKKLQELDLMEVVKEFKKLGIWGSLNGDGAPKIP